MADITVFYSAESWAQHLFSEAIHTYMNIVLFVHFCCEIEYPRAAILFILDDNIIDVRTGEHILETVTP